MKRWVVACSMAVGAWLVASSANAQDAPRKLALHWSAPDECADDVRLVHQIEGLLGESLLEAGEQSLTVHVTAQGSVAQGYAAKLAFVSPQGREERYLEHPSCEKLVAAVALVIALAIDSERVRATQRANEVAPATPRAEPPRLAPLAPQPPPAVPSAPARVPPREQHARRAFRLALHGLVGAGPLPGFGAGMEAGLAWQRERLRIALGGRYWLSRNATVSFAPPAAVEIGLVTLGARGCWLAASDPWRFAACGGGDLGNERGSGSSLESTRSKDALFAQLSAGAQVAYERARLQPEAGFELSAVLARPRFGVRDAAAQEREVFQAEAWAFNAFFGLAFDL